MHIWKMSLIVIINVSLDYLQHSQVRTFLVSNCNHTDKQTIIHPSLSFYQCCRIYILNVRYISSTFMQMFQIPCGSSKCNTCPCLSPFSQIWIWPLISPVQIAIKPCASRHTQTAAICPGQSMGPHSQGCMQSTSPPSVRLTRYDGFPLERNQDSEKTGMRRNRATVYELSGHAFFAGMSALNLLLIYITVSCFPFNLQKSKNHQLNQALLHNNLFLAFLIFSVLCRVCLQSA